ncbi:MAG: DNA-binding response regulator [Anaerolineae bacterium]|nr:DNA-binding response regulator [Anaerolineae bacterium]
MKQKTILFVDNSTPYLDVHAELLAKVGYRVYRAYTLAEAEEKLHVHHVHLIILDVRMEDDNDEQDISGLIWAQQAKYRPIPKIILTAYPSYEHAREALGPRLDRLPPAVNFIGKDEGIDEIIRGVERVFAEHVRINWQLAMHWAKSSNLSLPHLITLIEPQLDNVYFSSRVEELEDVLGALFYSSHQINIAHRFAVGRNKVILGVYTFSEDGLLARYVVVCGLRDAVQRESAGHEKYANPTATEGSTSRSSQLIETTHYAALSYTLTDTRLEDVVTLTEFYRRNPADAIIRVLDYLFDRTLAHYHQQKVSVTQSAPVMEAFLPYVADKNFLTTPVLQRCITTLQTKGAIDDFARFDESALQLLTALVDKTIPLEASIKWGIIHGSLSGDTMVVDGRGRAWLIDFAEFGPGPLVQEFVTLENAVKFDLADQLDYQDRKKLEEYLHIGLNAEEDIADPDASPEMRKALTVINHIRRRAIQRLGQSPKLYQAGLLLKTVERLASYNADTFYFNHELAIYFHALHAVRELCKQLSPPPPNYANPHSPWLDEGIPGYDVWVEGQWINLAEMEYKLLLVLYRQAVDFPHNPRCKFSDIGRGVWGEYDRLRDYNNVQSLVRRVRERIQPDEDDAHQYIENIRGVGYSLNLKYHDPQVQ